MNLSQLRTQIDRRTGRLQDVPAANAYINEAINIISSRREWPWLDAVQTITTTLDENTYSVPANYSETRSVNIAGLEAQQIYVADGDDFNGTSYRPGTYEYVIEWLDGDAELHIFPTPPADTAVVHRYTRTEGLISSDNAQPLMPERYHSILCDMAAALFLERIEPSRSEFYMARAEQALKKMGEAVQRKANPGRIRTRHDWDWV